MPDVHTQRDQPPGVPPLELTGERTLPDVPDENYWYRRHLAVYEWIAARVEGLRVVDLACGEGYGSNVLAATAAEVVGIDANPEAHEHARRRYVRPNLAFERSLVEEFRGPCDAVVFLQTIEHIHDPGALCAQLAAAAPTAYISTPNRLTLAPRAPRSPTTRGTFASTRSRSTGSSWGRTSRPSRSSASITPASSGRTSWRSDWDGTACTPPCA